MRETKKPTKHRLVWCPGGGKAIDGGVLGVRAKVTRKGHVRCPTCNRRLKASVIDCEVWSKTDQPRVKDMSCVHRWIPNHKAMIIDMEVVHG